MAETILKSNIRGARELARKLLKDVGFIAAPISLKRIVDHIKKQQRLEVIGHQFGDKISGVLVRIDDEATIGFNSDQSEVRQRFTVAHEIGHLLLGHTCEGLERQSQKEVEANQFAAELLAPREFLKHDFQKTPDVTVLAEKYIMSEQALCIRLVECRLI